MLMVSRVFTVVGVSKHVSVKRSGVIPFSCGVTDQIGSHFYNLVVLKNDPDVEKQITTCLGREGRLWAVEEREQSCR